MPISFSIITWPVVGLNTTLPCAGITTPSGVSTMLPFASRCSDGLLAPRPDAADTSVSATAVVL